MTEIGEEIEPARALVVRDCYQARADLYLRLLYSPITAAVAFGMLESHPALVSAQTARMLESIDRRRLEDEQAARLRQIHWHLVRELPLLERIVGTRALRDSIPAFPESSEFWRGLGRTIGECFCVYMVRVCPGLSSPARDLLRLAGILSALVNCPHGASPWPAAKTGGSAEEAASESFFSEWRLAQAWAQLEARVPGPLEQLVEAGASLLMVSVEAQSRVRVLSLEVP